MQQLTNNAIKSLNQQCNNFPHTMQQVTRPLIGHYITSWVQLKSPKM
uniref:Uncharacterized protein n=1 Tax=Anguilla anguilla TaxID=7936 RepID=A0A0E9T224_ANGAN